MPKHFCTAIAAAALCLGLAGPVAAQSDAAATEFSNTDLQAYAAAAVRVREISDRWREQAEQLEDEARLQALQAEVQAEMANAVRDQGLSVGDYNQIYQATQTDQELRERIVSMIQQMQ